MNRSIPQYSVRQPVLVNLLAAVILTAGAFVYQQMTRESLPAVPVGMAAITTTYPGASASEVEELVTAPLEEVILALDDDIDKVESASQEGVSHIYVTFDASVKDVTRAVMNVSNAVNGVQDLPADAEAPRVVEGKTNFPIIAVSIRGDVEPRTLREVARSLADQLERIDDVAFVNRHGLARPELVVSVHPDRLSAHHLALPTIAQALRERVSNVPAGTLQRGRHSQLVRAMTQVQSPQDIERVAIGAGGEAGAVTIGDIAQVDEELSYAHDRAWVDGQPGVVLVVFRADGADALRLSKRVRALVKRESALVPSGVKVQVFGDTSEEILRSLNALYTNAWIGLLLVLLLLWAFVGLRNAVMAALGIPVALAGGILVMSALDITINTVSLFALILCLGVIVDDAIIIIENVYRHMQEGMPRKQAAIEGTREVFWPVVSSTLTTSAAFLPLLLMTGTIGKFFAIIPKVVVAALTASLIEALFVLPSHMADFGAVSSKPKTIADAEPTTNDRFSRFVRRALDYPKTLIVLGYSTCAVLLALSITSKDVVLFSDADVEMFDVRVHMPTDSTREQTDAIMGEISRRLAKLPGDDIEKIQTVRGYTRTNLFPVTGDHTGMATVFLKPPGRRSSPTVGTELMAQASAALADVVGPRTLEVIEFRPGPPSGAPVGVRLLGEDRDRVAELSELVMAELRAIEGTRDVARSYALGKRELRVRVDEQRAALYNLTAPQVAEFLRGAFSDAPIAKTRKDNEEVEIKLRLASTDSAGPHIENNRAALSQLPIVSPSGAEVTLSELATIEHTQSAAVLERFDGRRSIMVTSQIDDNRTTSQRANRELMARIEPLRAQYPDVSFEFGGQWEETQESLRSLLAAFALAALLIFSILASQFRSFSQPLIVMAAIPLSLIGVSIGFLLSSDSVGLIALVGVVGLAGIVVNDSLVLVEFINVRRASGVELRTAIVQAARLRLRPIILTSITTIAGLMPLALGLGGRSPLLAPMAIAISWGLTFSTVLIVVLIPCLYLTVDQMGSHVARLFAPLTRKLTDPGLANDEELPPRASHTPQRANTSTQKS